MSLTITVMLIGFAVMMSIERLRPRQKFPHTPYWWSRVIGFNALQAATAFLAAASWDRWFASLSWLDFSSISPLIGALIGYLTITFIYYWWHRARHEVPFLWRNLHQLHHSPQRLEVTTSFYKHPAEIILNGLLSSAILLVFLGLSPLATSIAVLMTGLAELFYHWNIKTPRWLGFIIQRPESHCVHHQQGRHRNNYSDLPLWDMLFGTFENPTDHHFECGFGDNKELALGDLLLGRELTETQGSDK